MLIQKKILVTITILIALGIFIKCINNSEVHNDVRGSIYAGPATCANCHKDIHDHYLNSAHYNTSKFATQKSILGNFNKENNFFIYNDSDKVLMQKIKDSFYQTQYINGIKKRSQHFDIVIGSGRKAQTYLYYKGDQIYELPVSYFICYQFFC